MLRIAGRTPSGCAIPTSMAVMVFPAEAQYQLLCTMIVPKYFSIAILQSFNTMKALELFEPR
jgi:hypothetical protein